MIPSDIIHSAVLTKWMAAELTWVVKSKRDPPKANTVIYMNASRLFGSYLCFFLIVLKGMGR